MRHCHLLGKYLMSHNDALTMSFHTFDNERLQISHAALGSMCAVALPSRIDVDAETILLRSIGKIPDDLLDRVISVPVKDTPEGPSLSLEHPVFSDWARGWAGVWVAYGDGYFRLTKIKEAKQGPCNKQQVAATLISTDGELFAGTNRCNCPQSACPRDVLGMKSGEGYHLCHEVCQQPAHAEVDAIRRAGEKAKGAVIYLTGHHYACSSCQQAALDAGAQIVVSRQLR